MKYLKMLGLAAMVALALMAVAGAGTALATGGVLCEDVTEPCDAKWAVNAHMTFSLKAKTKAKITTEFGATLLECSESALTAKVLSAGTFAERARLEIQKGWVTWAKCGAEEKGPAPTSVTPGELEFTWREEPETKGTVFAKKVVIKSQLGGFNCFYTLGAETDLGKYTPGAAGKDGIIALVGVPLALEDSAAHPSPELFCPHKVLYDAEYTLTTDTALYIKGE